MKAPRPVQSMTSDPKEEHRTDQTTAVVVATAIPATAGTATATIATAIAVVVAVVAGSQTWHRTKGLVVILPFLCSAHAHHGSRLSYRPGLMCAHH